MWCPLLSYPWLAIAWATKVVEWTQPHAIIKATNRYNERRERGRNRRWIGVGKEPVRSHLVVIDGDVKGCLGLSDGGAGIDQQPIRRNIGDRQTLTVQKVNHLLLLLHCRAKLAGKGLRCEEVVIE